MARILNAVLILQLVTYLLIAEGAILNNGQHIREGTLIKQGHVVKGNAAIREGAFMKDGAVIKGHCANAVRKYLALVLKMYPGIVLPPFQYPEEPCTHLNPDSTYSSNHDKKKTTIYVSDIPKGGIIIDPPNENSSKRPSRIDQFQYGHVLETPQYAQITDGAILGQGQGQSQNGHEASSYGYAQGASQYGQVVDASYNGQVSGVVNYGQGTLNNGHSATIYGQSASNYGQGGSNYVQGASNYGQGPFNYGQGASNYGHSTSSYGQGASNYAQGASNYVQDASIYGHAASPYGQAPGQIYIDQVPGTPQYGQTVASTLNPLQHGNVLDASKISSHEAEMQKFKLLNQATVLQHENYNTKKNHHLQNISPNLQHTNIGYRPYGPNYFAESQVNMGPMQRPGTPNMNQGHRLQQDKMQQQQNMFYQEQIKHHQKNDLTNVAFQHSQQNEQLYGAMQNQKNERLRKETVSYNKGMKEVLTGYTEGQRETVINHQGIPNSDIRCSDNSELCITVN